MTQKEPGDRMDWAHNSTKQRYDCAFEEGNLAFHAGVKRTSNPHIEDFPSAEASGWAAGWDWGKIHTIEERERDNIANGQDIE